MFENNNPKNLIVVSKDELAANLLTSLVQTNDDKDDNETVGTRDNEVHIISWDESVWLDQKKAGTISDKVLFIGNVKNINKLSPIINYKYDQWGIKYGWAGDKAIISVSVKEFVKNKDSYRLFCDEYNKLSLLNGTEVAKKRVNVKTVLKKFVPTPGVASSLALTSLRVQSEIRKQQLVFGVCHFYLNHLQEFLDE